MANILTLVKGQPQRKLVRGEVLIDAGEAGGELYVLELGSLVVQRDGVTIATIEEPGALIGEMSVILGIDHSATVRAELPSTVRVVEDAMHFLERNPLMTLHVATLACERLNRTSALLVDLRKEAEGKDGEQGILSRIFSAMTAPAPKGRWAEHE